MDSEYEVRKYAIGRFPESHFHEFYEFFISLSNEDKFFVGEQAYPLSVGMIFCLKPFDIHHCFCRGTKDSDCYVIHFTREYLQKLSTKKTNLIEVFDSAPLVQKMPDELLMILLGRLATLMKPAAGNFGADVERNISFDLFLLTMARSIGLCSGYSNIHAKLDTRVVGVLGYIHKHYAEEITLDDLSSRFFISKSRLSQIFKNTTGASIGNYIIIYRIKCSCALLQSGESVQNAGRMVGFNNNTHYIRMFKKHMSCSPGRFARSRESAEGYAEEI